MAVTMDPPMMPRGMGTFPVRLSGAELRKLHEDRAAVHLARAEHGEKKIEALDRAIERLRAPRGPSDKKPTNPPMAHTRMRPLAPQDMRPLTHQEQMDMGSIDPRHLAAIERANVEHHIRHIRHDQQQIRFQIEEVKRVAASLSFIASHIDKDETYQVTDDVVERLVGPIASHYGPSVLDVDYDDADAGVLPPSPLHSHGVVRPIRPLQ